MKVRCPACRVEHRDPAAEFVCSGCGRHLMWRPRPPLLRAEQMSLFVPSGAAEPMTLPLTVDPADAEPGPRADTRPPVEPVGESRPSPLGRAVTLVTAMLPTPDEDPEAVGAVIVDVTQDDQPELVFALASLMAHLITHLDRELEGAGTAWLQLLALAIAAEGEAGAG